MNHTVSVLLFSLLCWEIHPAAASPSEQTRNDNIKRISQLKNMPLESLFDIRVFTPSKHEEDINDSPGMVQVITRRQIEQRRYTNLIDLLEDLPGIDTFRNSKSTIYHNISFRGHLSNSKFLILQDGVRIESTSGARIAVADNYPLFHARQVEVLYGPAAALYGADAFAGVINIITEDGDAVDGARLSAATGSDGYRRYTAHAGGRLGKKLEWTLAAHSHASDTGDLAAAYPDSFPRVDATAFDGRVMVPAAERENYHGAISSESAFAKLNWDDRLQAGFNYSLFRNLSSTGDRPDTALYLPESEWNTRQISSYVRWQQELSEHLTMQVLADFNRYEVTPASKFYNIYVDFQDYGYEYAKSDKQAVELQLDYRLNDAHRLIGGLVYEDFYSLPQVPDLPHPYNAAKGVSEQDLTYPNTDLPIRFFDVNYRNLATYLQWQAQWNPRWSSSIGLRYDNNSRYAETWNPRLGLVYKRDKQTVYKLLYGEAFRAPSTDEALSTFGTFSGAQLADGRYVSSFFRAPNFALEPETARSLEFSFNKALSEDWRFSFSAYYATVDNLIVTVGQDEPIQFIPGAYIKNTNIKDNAGEEYRYGMDLGLSHRRELAHGWQANFWATYSYIQGKLKESAAGPSLDLPYIAPHKLKLGATFSYRDWFITPKLYLIGRANTGASDPANPAARLTSPGYALAHLHIGKANVLVDNLSAYLDIYNLFDTRYYAAAGAASTTFTAMPQQPRSIQFSLHYRF